MKLLEMKKVHEGTYLHNYELTYENRAGRRKRFEIVSRQNLESPGDIAGRSSGIAIVAFQEEKLLLLREFRMSLNKPIYGLCSGLLEGAESAEECARRELMEETGLQVKHIRAILPSSYSSAGFSDVSIRLVFLEAGGSINVRASENEEIAAAFYTRTQVADMLAREEFSSLAQMAASFFCGMPFHLPRL